MKISKELILENTLLLIDERQGIRDVTLRDIAKKIGCAHTNLYNYFSSLDEIFWEALGMILNKMMNYCITGWESMKDPKEGFYLILSKLIDFSMEHPGWFRLIWLEDLNGNPSPEIEAVLRSPGKGFTEIISATEDGLTNEKADSIGNILMCYLQGELCIWLNNRSFVKDKEQAKQRMMTNLKELYRVLTL